MIMNEKQANVIFDILVAKCGAIEYDRRSFVCHISSGCKEFRFGGNLGFGGKFWSDEMRVDYYQEDRTPKRESIVKTTNARLVQLKVGLTTTVGELKAAISELPDNMPVQGYDGSNREHPVIVFVHGYFDVDSDVKSPPTLIVSVD